MTFHGYADAMPLFETLFISPAPLLSPLRYAIILILPLADAIIDAARC